MSLSRWRRHQWPRRQSPWSPHVLSQPPKYPPPPCSGPCPYLMPVAALRASPLPQGPPPACSLQPLFLPSPSAWPPAKAVCLRHGCCDRKSQRSARDCFLQLKGKKKRDGEGNSVQRFRALFLDLCGWGHSLQEPFQTFLRDNHGPQTPCDFDVTDVRCMCLGAVALWSPASRDI